MWMGLALVGLMMSLAPARAQDGAEAQAALARIPADQREAVRKFDRSLQRQSGRVALPGGHATLDLGQDYYFLSPEDAQRVLVEGWGNPPENGRGVLGMIFPAGRSFYDGTWGAVLTYDDSGHVDDKDAADEDYDAVLKDMRSAENEENAQRSKAGYPAVHLVGWAQPPSYDKAGKTLIWARDIKFAGGEQDTLNYDVRKLARTGVLSVNMVDTMDHLAQVRSAAVELGRKISFEPGQRYDDFDAKTDHMADYGLAGLVAAGAGLAVAKKLGVLGLLFVFLKKGFVIIAVAGAAMWRKIKGLFGFKDEPDAEWEAYVAEHQDVDAHETVDEAETGSAKPVAGD